MPEAATVAAESEMGVLIITHYQRILHMVTPSRVSIMYDGRIARTGGPELAEHLEEVGYVEFGVQEPASAPGTS